MCYRWVKEDILGHVLNSHPALRCGTSKGGSSAGKVSSCVSSRAWQEEVVTQQETADHRLHRDNVTRQLEVQWMP